MLSVYELLAICISTGFMLPLVPKLGNAKLLILWSTMSCYYTQMMLCDTTMLK